MNNGYNFFNDFSSEEAYTLEALLYKRGCRYPEDIDEVLQYLLDSSVDEGTSQTTFGNILLKVSNTIEHSGSGEHHSMESDTNVHLYGKGGVLLAEICYTIGSAHCCESQLLTFEVLLEENGDKLNKTIDTQEAKGDNMASLSTRVNERVNVELPTNTNTTKKDTNNMSTRNIRTVNATLNDNDSNLTLKDTLVFQKTLLRTERNDEKTIQNLLMSGKVQAALEDHNRLREESIDKSILKATGKKVFLEVVEIWDLEWKIVTIA